MDVGIQSGMCTTRTSGVPGGSWRRRGRRCGRWLIAAAAATAVLLGGGTSAAQDEDERPELRIRATPRVGFAPASILFVAELRGGADDYEEFYCLTTEWEWGDDTFSENTPDCDPYEPGVSEIRRRLSVRHLFNYPGSFTVRLRLKRQDDVVVAASTRVQVRGSLIRQRR